ncbi:hypothetical protein PM8797T_10364 [Gimesia maris DSM 8797]|nr:hypothetical protein PM8797T_10364 [Gimesia maris DSM 8797]
MDRRLILLYQPDLVSTNLFRDLSKEASDDLSFLFGFRSLRSLIE